MTLADVTPNTLVRITSINDLDYALKQRCRAMGIRVNSLVHVLRVRRTLLHIRIGTTDLAIRKTLAIHITVQKYKRIVSNDTL